MVLFYQCSKFFLEHVVSSEKSGGPILVCAALVAAGAGIRPSCRLLRGIVSARDKFRGRLGRFLPCGLGLSVPSLRRCAMSGQGLLSRPRESGRERLLFAMRSANFWVAVLVSGTTCWFCCTAALQCWSHYLEDAHLELAHGRTCCGPGYRWWCSDRSDVCCIMWSS